MVDPLKLATVVSQPIVTELRKKLPSPGWMLIWGNEDGDVMFISSDEYDVSQAQPKVFANGSPRGLPPGCFNITTQDGRVITVCPRQV